MSESSITVIVAEFVDESSTPTPYCDTDAFVAHVASNPRFRARGKTEEEAIERLKYLLTSCPSGVKRRFIRKINLDELLVEEIMDE